MLEMMEEHECFQDHTLEKYNEDAQESAKSKVCGFLKILLWLQCFYGNLKFIITIVV